MDKAIWPCKSIKVSFFICFCDICEKFYREYSHYLFVQSSKIIVCWSKMNPVCRKPWSTSTVYLTFEKSIVVHGAFVDASEIKIWFRVIQEQEHIYICERIFITKSLYLVSALLTHAAKPYRLSRKPRTNVISIAKG